MSIELFSPLRSTGHSRVTRRAAGALSALFCVLLAATSSAQQEIPIGSREEIPAPRHRGALRLASDGDGFLAIWRDGRNIDAAYAARIDRHGVVVDRLGIRLPFLAADLAWDGVNYVVSDRRSALRIRPDGMIVDSNPIQLVPDDSWGIAFTAKGPYSIAVYRDLPGNWHAAIFDRDLRPHGEPIRLPLSEAESYQVPVGVGALPDGSFLFLLTSSWYVCPTLCSTLAYQVDPVAAKLSRRYTIPTSPEIVGETTYELAVGTNAFAIATLPYETGKTVVRTFSLDGTPVGTYVLFQKDTASYGAPPHVATVGDGFIVSFTTWEGAVSTNRIARLDSSGTWDGSLINLDTADTPERRLPRVSWNGSSTLVAFESWLPQVPDSNFDIGLMSPTGELGDLSPLAYSLIPQSAVAITSNGDVDLALFSSGWYGHGYELRATTVGPNGPASEDGVLIATRSLGEVPGAAVASPGGFVVAWLDENVLYTRRLSLSGSWIDPEPAPVSTGVCYLSTEALKRSASGYVVAFVTCPPTRVMFQKLDSSGMPLDSATQVGPSAEGLQNPVVADGDDTHLVVWQYEPPYFCPITCYSPPAQLRGSIIGADGQPLGEPFDLTNNGEGSYNPPAVTWTGSNYLVAWGHFQAIHALRVSADGTLPDKFGGERLTSPGSGADPRPSLGFDGTHAIVIWSDSQPGRYEILRVLPIDPARSLTEQSMIEPGSLATGVSRGYSSSPTSVSSPRGRVLSLLYSRVAPDASFGGVGRVFVRRLEHAKRARPVRRPGAGTSSSDHDLDYSPSLKAADG
jgi:hypothetical protein